MFEALGMYVEMFKPILPFLGIVLLFGIIRLFINEGIKEGSKILIRTVIGIAVAALIFIITIQFI